MKKQHTTLYIIVLALIALLALANWQALSQPINFNLLVTQVVAPIGVLVFAIVAAVFLVDWVIYALRRHAWNTERQDLTRQLEESRLRADSAEESRIRGLRETLATELAAIRQKLDRLEQHPVPPTTGNQVTYVRDPDQPRIYEKKH
jgi:uncharacterized membrane protein YciS (DUF1049 family)